MCKFWIMMKEFVIIVLQHSVIKTDKLPSRLSTTIFLLYDKKKLGNWANARRCKETGIYHENGELSQKVQFFDDWREFEIYGKNTRCIKKSKILSHSLIVGVNTYAFSHYDATWFYSKSKKLNHLCTYIVNTGRTFLRSVYT